MLFTATGWIAMQHSGRLQRIENKWLEKKLNDGILGNDGISGVRKRGR
jgi:hypothetical protein